MLMDLSKAFDCIPQELLIAKMDAYVFSENTLRVFFFSYFKRQKQGVQINNTRIVFFNYFNWVLRKNECVISSL